MVDVARAWWGMTFEVQFARRRGDAFQDFFKDVMGRRYPRDFRPVRPWAADGDRKNDGYLPSQRKIFHVYAPSDYRKTELLAKMDADWKGAIGYWEPYFDDWIFVHNDVDGLAPGIEVKIQELDAAHPKVSATAWGKS